MDAKELTSALAHCTGTEGYMRHPLVRSFLMTDGAKCFFDNAGGGAYWLADILATEPAIRKLVMEKSIAFATFTVKDAKGLLTVIQDEGMPPVFKKTINLTDCPEGTWKLWMQAASIDAANQIVCMVPSEY